MRAWWIAGISLLLHACAATPGAGDAPRDGGLFHDALFAAPTEHIDPAEVFAISGPMRRYLRVDIAEQLESRGRQKGLFEALYSSGQLKLQYDAALTRTAAQAFEARSGNCLSLVIMTAALARELGLDVRYQRVFSEETWSRVGELHVGSSHVNITLGHRSGDPRALFADRETFTIDFMPVRRGMKYRAFELREATVIAMFMNNRAAEALAANRADDAYWWARAAIGQDPTFLAAYNTLGVVYRHRGHLRESEQVLAYVMEREPANTYAMSNLVLVMKDEGRIEESEALKQKLERLEPVAPFHYFELGLDAMKAKDYAAARAYFIREIERDSTYHEFHFWLAAAYNAMGDATRARHHLSIALANSTTRGERELYAAKLDRIGR
jgi:tetratricopeptide (TPR) repeat protein